MSAEPQPTEDMVPISEMHKQLARARRKALSEGFKVGTRRAREVFEKRAAESNGDTDEEPEEDAPPAVSSHRFDTPSGLPAAALFHLGGGSATTGEESEPAPGSIEWLLKNTNLKGESVHRGRMRFPPEPPPAPPKGDAPTKPTTIHLEES
jgi:hypothetical protein